MVYGDFDHGSCVISVVSRRRGPRLEHRGRFASPNGKSPFSVSDAIHAGPKKPTLQACDSFWDQNPPILGMWNLEIGIVLKKLLAAFRYHNAVCT